MSVGESADAIEVGVAQRAGDVEGIG